MGETKKITPTYLRQHVYEILDEVLTTGQTIEIERKGSKVRIEPAPKLKRDLSSIPRRKGVYDGRPDDLVHLDWSSEWNPDFP